MLRLFSVVPLDKGSDFDPDDLLKILEFLEVIEPLESE